MVKLLFIFILKQKMTFDKVKITKHKLGLSCAKLITARVVNARTRDKTCARAFTARARAFMHKSI